MNPWTKTSLLLIVVGFATVLTDVYLLLVLYVTTLLFYIIGRLPVKVLLGWYTLPVMFVITLVIMFVFNEPGEDLLRGEVGPLTVAITDQGVLLMVKLIVRALAVVTMSLAVFMTTKYGQISEMAHRIMPTQVATVFLLSYRFMFVTSDELTDVLDAVNARSGSLARGVARQTRLYAGIFGLAFVHAFERAERISKAMESRGFVDRLPITHRLERPSVGGYVLIAICALLLVIAAYARYLDPDFIGRWT